MTIYTVTLITLQVRTNEPEVHVFTNKEAAQSFAFTWMITQADLDPNDWAGYDISYEQMEYFCIRKDICTVDIQSHSINLPQE